MVEYKDCKTADILEDAKKDAHKKAYLKELAKGTVRDKNGKERKISFFQLKRAYYTKFYPELLPAREVRKSIFELIEEL